MLDLALQLMVNLRKYWMPNEKEKQEEADRGKSKESGGLDDLSAPGDLEPPSTVQSIGQASGQSIGQAGQAVVQVPGGKEAALGRDWVTLLCELLQMERFGEHLASHEMRSLAKNNAKRASPHSTYINGPHLIPILRGK